MTDKTIRRLHPALRDDIGDLLTQRPVPSHQLEQIDPFLFLNHHGPQVYGPHNRGLPFGPHPHRGFETVTFIVDGMLAHRDSAGHESVIHAGGIQWMTAGSGIVHAENTVVSTGMRLFQLWLILPEAQRNMPPRVQVLRRALAALPHRRAPIHGRRPVVAGEAPAGRRGVHQRGEAFYRGPAGRLLWRQPFPIHGVRGPRAHSGGLSDNSVQPRRPLEHHPHGRQASWLSRDCQRPLTAPSAPPSPAQPPA